MKLYYAPGACSLADHIALHEAGLTFQHDKVDFKTKKTESGQDYTAINPKGYVPALELDSGGILTENTAILDWIATQNPELCPAGELGRSRLIEMLAYLSSEVHKAFGPFFGDADEDEKAQAKKKLHKRLDYVVDKMEGDFLFGSKVSAADFYLFVMLTWAQKMNIEVPEKLASFRDRMMQRPSVQKAMQHEGLLEKAS